MAPSSRPGSRPVSAPCGPTKMDTDASERYANFSDNTMKDRLAARAAEAKLNAPRSSKRSSSVPSAAKLGSQLEPSGRCEGWDKYYFFSVPGAKAYPSGPNDVKVDRAKIVADPPLKLPTANLGRSRPAAHGPQTFCTTAFSKEVIERERPRIEKRGARTNYTELFSQLPRAPSAILGLPTYEGQKFEKGPGSETHPGMRLRECSETLLQGPPPDMTHSTGVQERKRMGPYWPPKTEERPTSLKTREALFPGGHRTFVDLHSCDRPASRGVGYAVFVG